MLSFAGSRKSRLFGAAKGLDHAQARCDAAWPRSPQTKRIR